MKRLFLIISFFIFILNSYLNANTGSLIIDGWNWKIVDNFTFTTDAEVYGNVTITGGICDLKGNTLKVKGDLIVKGGVLFFNGGGVRVQGNMIIEKKGRIKMTNERDSLVVNGDLTAEGYSLVGYLTSGTIILKGNFKEGTYCDSSTFFGKCYYDNFYATDNLTVIFSGDKKQTVSFTNPEKSKFAIVKLENTSEEGVEFLTGVKFDELIQNNTKLTINVIDVDIKLKHDLVLEDNLTISKGTFNLNGHKLVVKKDLYVGWNSTLILNGGELDVGGNMTIKKKSLLKMTNEKDVLKIEGDLYVNGISTKGYLTAGLIELKGNFKQEGYYDSTFVGKEYLDNFYATDNLTVIFSGNKKQTVSFANPGKSKFAIVKLENTSKEGVEFLTGVKFDELIQNNTKLTINVIDVDIKLKHDLVLEDNLSISNGGKLDLNGHKLVVKKDLYMGWNSTLILNGGELDVGGNMEIKKGGLLIMTNEKDVLRIEGDLYVNGISTKGYLTAGLIELKGNFKQETYYKFGKSYSDNFYATDNLTVIFSGDKKQTVSFDNTKYSKFAIVKLENTSEEGVVFLTKVVYDKLISSKGCNEELFQCKNQLECENAGGIWKNNFCYPETEGENKLFIQKGWNLAGLPMNDNDKEIPIEEFFNINSIITVWKWDNGWKLWSPNNEIKKLINDYHVAEIKILKIGEGFWIKSSEYKIIDMGEGTEYGIEKLTLNKKGWVLCGIGKEENIEIFKDIDGLLTVWKWKNKEWKVWSSNEEILKIMDKFGIKLIEKLEKGDGFWIYLK